MPLLPWPRPLHLPAGLAPPHPRLPWPLENRPHLFHHLLPMLPKLSLVLQVHQDSLYLSNYRNNCIGLVQSRHLLVCQKIPNTMLPTGLNVKTIGSFKLQASGMVHPQNRRPCKAFSRFSTQKPRYFRLLDHVIITTHQWPINICVLAIVLYWV